MMATLPASKSVFLRIGRLFASAVMFVFVATSVVALDNPEKRWSDKAWHAEFQEGRCAIWTGGDGSGTFEIEFSMGGFNASARYVPIVYSNYPVPLRIDDELELIIDGRISGFGYEMSVFDGHDSFGRYMVEASMTGSMAPDLIPPFRASSDLAVQVQHAGEAPFIADAFSLSGFTSVYLKISEWCHFDPNNLFRS